MIHASLFKIDYSGQQCANPECAHNPEHHFNIIGKVFHIKQDTTCLRLSMATSSEIIVETYCKDCIDVVYRKLKPILDKNLWIFQ